MKKKIITSMALSMAAILNTAVILPNKTYSCNAASNNPGIEINGCEDTSSGESLPEISSNVGFMESEDSFLKYAKDNGYTNYNLDGDNYQIEVDDNGKECVKLSDDKTNVCYGIGNSKVHSVFKYCLLLRCAYLDEISIDSGSKLTKAGYNDFSIDLSETTSLSLGFDWDSTIGAGFGGFVSTGISISVSREQETETTFDATFEYTYSDEIKNSNYNFGYDVSLKQMKFLIFTFEPKIYWTNTIWILGNWHPEAPHIYLTPTIKTITVNLYTYVNCGKGSTR